MKRIFSPSSKLKNILLWLIAMLYLLFSPSLHYHLLTEAGKPLSVWKQQPQVTNGIRYNVEDLKYWSKNMVSYDEGEIYALWGWAFLDVSPNTFLADFDRRIILYKENHVYVYPIQVYQRPGVQDVFNDLGLNDLSSSGFYSVISRNALADGRYGIGLLFQQKQHDTIYYIQTNKVLVRTPNHLSLETVSE